jgi:hypothetical protein
MTKPADDKLGHAKREIKALTGQLSEAREDVRRCEKWRAEDKEKYELLEVLVESLRSCSAMDCDLIDSLQEQVEELETAAITPKGYKLVPIKPTRNMIDAAHDSQCITRYEATITWEEMIEASPTPPEQEPSE